ncbi:MAG: 50S ribosomal protein L29 [Candidatus Omnitrophica bacterium]|nr:50S ribosomal protein L29 [Candidatus Omnitrophota bacterium]
MSKKQNLETLKNMTDAELTQKVSSLHNELYKFKFDAKSGRLEKPHMISALKKDIARCNTIVRERKSGRV